MKMNFKLPEAYLIYNILLEHQEKGDYCGNQKHYYNRVVSIINKFDKAFKDENKRQESRRKGVAPEDS